MKRARMRPEIQRRLLAVNRRFYETVADEFHHTRQGWTPGLLAILPYIPEGTKQRPATVLDVGCGNGRLARLLEERGGHTEYTGVDRDPRLLALARKSTAPLARTRCRFLQADLADPSWTRVLGPEEPRFQAVVCLATLQHLPGYELRRRVVQDLARLSQGVVILSFWQFLEAPRFQAKLLDWTTVGLSPQDVEPGDALLPWKQGPYAVRYVHQVDPAELVRLAWDAGLGIRKTFRADGKEGNLNLYAILEPMRDRGEAST